MKKRTLIMLLIMLMTVSMYACGSDETPAVVPEADTVAVSEETEEELFKIQRENNDGRNFNMLVPTDYAYEYPTETVGEVMNDALYDRNLKAEEYFNIKITTQIEPGHWNDKDSYNSYIVNAVIAGDSTYDLATGMIACTVPTFMKGVFADVNAYSSDLDLSNPWWFAEQKEKLSINGHLYQVAGDASISVYKNAVVTYFNKQVLNDNAMEDPYTLVANNQWTIGKMFEMAEAAAVDLNGDGKIKPADDRLGCYLQDVPLRLSGNAFDVNLFKVDIATGNIVRNIDVLERLVKAYEYTRLFFEVEYLFDNETTEDLMGLVAAFTENRALFHISYLYVTESDLMRNMEADFGIVPYPKLDETQNNHITPVATSTNLLFIPLTASDIPLTCRVLEAFGYFTMSEVVPTYYEVALQEKYTRDMEVQDMFTIIRDSMRLSFDCCYGTTFQLNGGQSNPGNLLAFAKKEMVSFYESKVAAWDVFVEELNAYK